MLHIVPRSVRKIIGDLVDIGRFVKFYPGRKSKIHQTSIISGRLACIAPDLKLLGILIVENARRKMIVILSPKECLQTSKSKYPLISTSIYCIDFIFDPAFQLVS